ncbi:hypothetical protein WDU94_001989 [Cyamophila willieti]
MKDTNIDMKYKSDLFNTHILPALTYASETWSTTKQEEEGLQVIQRAIERRMCNISLKDHITNTEIRERTKVKDVVEGIYTNKRRWAGHIARTKDNRWTKRVTEWYPRNKNRKQGRPATRWADPITKVAGKLWMRAAQNREGWRLCDLQHWRNPSNVDTTDPSRIELILVHDFVPHIIPVYLYIEIQPYLLRERAYHFLDYSDMDLWYQHWYLSIAVFLIAKPPSLFVL